MINGTEYHEYMPKSFTKYRNKIGLIDGNGEFIVNRRDIALVFPYKDCVLEGGQTKDDQRRQEVFFNESIAKDEITTLLDPKVFVGAQRFTPDGVEPALDFRDNDNLIVEGNNLIALASLRQRFNGRIKMAYWDIPYNTGSDSFGYNDRFNHSTWLVFIKNRLEIAKKLLRNDGSIFIQCDDNEQAYLKVLCDELFGRDNFVATVIWEKKYSPQNDAKWLSDSHDFILVYAKNKNRWRPNLLPRTPEMNARYKNPDNDPRGPWISDNFSVRTYTEAYDYPIETPSGRLVNPPKGRAWMTHKNKFLEMLADNRIIFGKNGDGRPTVKRFLAEVKQGLVSKTIWFRDEVGDNMEAKRELLALDFPEIFSTPKPERLLQRIIQLATDEGDFILDFFMGSATTAAVALKMRRRFIGIEQMNYIDTVTIPRLQKVIEGEQSGISKAVDWKGGGSFVYCELARLNQVFVDDIERAADHSTIKNILDRAIKIGYIDYRLDTSKMNDEEFAALTLDEQKQLVMEILDKNMLYVNAYDINDAEFEIGAEDKAFTRSFYDGRDN